MQYRINMGYQAQEGGGFKACVEWQIADREPQMRFSPEIYATEADALGEAEYMARLFNRIADAMGYDTEEIADVSHN